MKIGNVGNITLGAFISRISPKLDENYSRYPLFTMQELAKETGQYSITVNNQYINISANKLDKIYFAEKNMIIIGLTSYKSLVVSCEQEGKFIPSNFAFVNLDLKKVDPFYFTWYFNENTNIRRQLKVAMQGSMLVKPLSIQMIRELEMDLPPLNLQKKIGLIYKLRSRKEKLLFEKNILEQKLYKEIIMKKLKEENKKCH